jgi:hypothetical protein
MKIKDEREELEKLINQSPEKIGKEAIDIPEELKNEPAFDIDFAKLQKNCDKRAKKMVHNATGFMLTDEVVKDNPYLKNKMEVDVISLAGMLYQLEASKTMQTALMEEARAGALHPRMFEVFGQLTKVISELNKQLLQTVEAIKVTYRDIKNDIREKNQDLAAIGEGSISRGENGIVALGTKELIKETKKLKMKQRDQEDDEIQDVEEVKD